MFDPCSLLAIRKFKAPHSGGHASHLLRFVFVMSLMWRLSQVRRMKNVIKDVIRIMIN